MDTNKQADKDHEIGDVNMLTVMQGAASWVQILFERSQVA
jgi:hypothetical protein